MTLEELLALLPDNSTGAIDAADLRTVVEALWARTIGWAGHVDSTGAIVSGPAGWTGERVATGAFKVNHTFAPTESYSVVVTPMSLESQAPVTVTIIATTPSSFTYLIAGEDAVPVNRDANFVVGVNR